MNPKLVALMLALGVLVGRAARAAPVDVSIAPILGQEAPACAGWIDYAVRVRGVAPGTERGTVELSDGSGASVKAPFAVAGGEQVTFELFFHDVFGKTLELVTRDAAGNPVGRSPVPSARAEGPLLFDLSSPSRVSIALRDEHIPAREPSGGYPIDGGLPVTVTSPRVDARTGEPRLPTRSLGYASVTVTLARSDALVGAGEAEIAALADWVLAGGVLAVAVTRPDDLRHERFRTLLGGAAEVAAESASRFVDFEVPIEPGGSPVPASVSQTRRVAPAADVTARLVGYRGGNLVPTRWGSRAAYGLGEIHLLAFDPDSPAFVDDAWVRRSVVDLVRASFARRTVVAFGGGAAGFDESRLEPVRRLLDPNEKSRLSIVLSAIALVVYSVLAGPVNFRRAARKGDPLRAMLHLPLWSLGALVLVVGIGAAPKGGRARARRLSVAECGAGMARCAMTRVRALFASSAETLRVRATDSPDLLDLAHADRGVTRTLVLERDAARLEDLYGRPWETLLLREDGVSTLDGAVGLVATGDGDVAIENALPRDLVAVVARAPGGSLRYFPRIPSGASVRIASGRSVGTPSSSAASPYAPATHARLSAYAFASLANATRPGVGDAWVALEVVAPDGTDFWPADVPALVAELDGAGDRRSDSGLAVDSDRVLVRVVGYGGGK